METLRDGDRLAHAARRAHAAGKPVIAYKLGRSEIGQELAKSHTGAIAGSDATFDAFCRRHGIARVSMFESLVDVPALLVDRPPRTRQERVAVATTTGGGAAMVVDNMAMAGLDIVDPPQALVDWLKPLGIVAGEGKLVDLTLAGAKPEIVAGTIERLLADDGNDAVIFVVGSSAQFNPELAVEPLLKFARSAKPFAVSLTPSAEKSLALLTAAGVPAFRHPESCAEAMAVCLLRPAPQPVPALAEPERGALDALAAGRVSGFDERRAADFFAALGVPVAKALAIPDAKRIVAAVTEIGGPVALKILSADIAHKTEAGGVALGLPDGQTAAVAAREIEKRVKAHSPNAKLEGFLVQKMERGLAEVILGFRRDPLVGPTITVGLGGVLAEIYKDAATRLAPVDEAEARQMIEEVKGLATIRGYRNLPRGDVGALAKAIAAFSTLAHQAFADVSEAEINPLLVKRDGDGVVAVDGLVLLRRLGDARLRRLEELAEIVEHEIGVLQLVDLVGPAHHRHCFERQALDVLAQERVLHFGRRGQDARAIGLQALGRADQAELDRVPVEPCQQVDLRRRPRRRAGRRPACSRRTPDRSSSGTWPKKSWNRSGSTR